MELKDKLTIIYCSSNREYPEFEKRIRENILRVKGDLPIIAVTQKSIYPNHYGSDVDCSGMSISIAKDGYGTEQYGPFGLNVVVGDDIGVSGFNFFRQSLIACKMAKTQFVVSAEADCLYPEDYFQWVPPRDDKCYRSDNVYVMGQHRKYFFRKPRGATHAQIVNREFYIENLERCFEGEPMWDATQFNFPKEKFHAKWEDVFKKGDIEYFMQENPVVQIKTSQSMRNYTSSIREPIYDLPYWGSGKDFRAKFYTIIRDGIKIIH